MNSTAQTSGGGSRSSRFYFVVWLALGAAGIFYVTIASLAPEALRANDASSAIEATNQQVASLSTAVTQIKTRVDTQDKRQQEFAGSLNGVIGDVTGLKTKVTDLDQTITTRLSSADAPPAPASNTAAQAISAKPAAAAPKIEGEVVAADGSADTAAPADAAAAKKPVKLASADPAAKPKPYAVDLAMSTSSDALRQIWQLFKDQHAELLAGLTPRSVTSGSNVRLLAGPFPSQAAAAAQCAKMRKEGMSCSPTPLAGTPL